MEKIIILGNGGHARSIVDAIEREGKYQIVGYVVNDNITELEQNDYPIVGNDDDLVELYESGIHHVVIGIGYLGKGNQRRKLYMQLKQIGYSLPIICDPFAIISSKARIGEGTFVGKGAIINADTLVGRACIVNSGAIIEHDCYIGDFSHISVGATLCGGVSVGVDAFIGANATVIQEISLADKVVIGAGAVIIHDVKEECTVLGNPGRISRK